MIKIKPGDIIFVRGSGVINKLIKWLDKGEFSHVAIAIDKFHILEAKGGISSSINHVRYNESDYEIVSLGLSESQQETLLNEITHMLDKKYDYNLFFHCLLKEKYRPKSGKYYICSELVEKALQRAGYDVKGIAVKTPNELYRALKRGMK